MPLTRALLSATLICLVTACETGGGGEGEGEGEGENEGSFHAVIDAVAWDADPEHVVAVVTDFTDDPRVTITASDAETGDHFNIQLQAFTGEFETTDVEPLVLRFTSGDVYEAVTGALSVTQSASGSEETYTGTFNGSFSNVTGTVTKVITDGVFTAYRSL